MFVTNHLAPFLLTNLLLDRLRAAPAARILTITAPSTVSLDFDDVQGVRRSGALRAFGASKMANLLFTYELARRMEGSPVIACAIHPGLVRSNLMKEAAAPIRWLTRLFSGSPEQAAISIVHVATAPEFAGRNGRFYHRGKEITSNAYSHDPAVQRRLWELSAALAGLEG